MENKTEKINSGFQPRITLENSFFWYLLGLVFLKPLQLVLVVVIVVILHVFGIKGLTVEVQQLVVDASYVISLVLIIILVRKIVINREIKKHNKELEQDH